MENWTPLTHDQVERRFIEMINDYLKIDLVYPLDPNMSIKDLRLVGDLKEIATLLRWEDLIGYITDSQDPTKIKKK